MLTVTGSRIRLVIKKWGITAFAILCLLCWGINWISTRQSPEGEKGQLGKQIGVFMKEQMEATYFMLPRYIEDKAGMGRLISGTEQLLLGAFPIYEYLFLQQEKQTNTEDEMTADILRKQRMEETDGVLEEQGTQEDENLYVVSNMMTEMEKENSLHNTDAEEQNEEIREEKATSEQSSLRAEETEEPVIETGNFTPAQYPVYSYDWSETWDYEGLVSNFYAVDNSTMLQEEYLDLDSLLYKDLSVDKSVEGPQILIYHTHAHEAFADSVEGEEETTIVGAGTKLASLLEEEYGFKVLHHKGVYDDEREDAYAEALPAVEKILEENPTIEVVIDLHRDGMSGDRKLVMDLQGKPTARFMFFNGLSYTKKGGDISYLENPYIQENLALSFQAQVAANQYYPGIARKVYLKAYRYNMHLKPKSMLIELGAQNNTVEEIMNACDPLAHILAIVLDDVVY